VEKVWPKIFLKSINIKNIGQMIIQCLNIVFSSCNYQLILITLENKKKSPWRKRILIGGLIGLVAAAAVIWYVFTVTFEDTADQKAAYTVSADNLIKEFIANDSLANKKYTEQIVVVNGIVSETEVADTTVNIKFIDTTTGSYAIFAFQQQHIASAKTLKAGDKVSIKGSCSGGAFSEILETEYITFKRCAINK
jgi:uncharacterized protein (DUF2141 family)